MGAVALEAVGHVEASRTHAEDDYWGEEQSCIVLEDRFSPDALDGLEEFSHVEVLFAFHQVDPAKIVSGARHPRNNADWPAVGIFAQRGKNRPIESEVRSAASSNETDYGCTSSSWMPSTALRCSTSSR